jgi:light-regulated signal transduction histidine kinase (bacteriophytochrome)
MLFAQAIGHQGSIKRSQEKLRQLNASLEERVNERTRQLEDTISELESFSYTVSHNLRSPLRAINGYSNLIEREIDMPPDSESRDMLKSIKSSAQLMGQMMDELLAFIQLGRKPIQKTTVNPNLLVENVLEELNFQRENHPTEFTIQPLPSCSADLILLRQVYLNLLSNAIKYSRQRDVARIEVGSQKDGEGKTVYFVRDNGVGFDMRYYDKLFGVFHRLHHEHEFEGIGVGLAFAYRIILRHGGRMWAESKVDEGATFFFTLE